MSYLSFKFGSLKNLSLTVNNSFFPFLFSNRYFPFFLESKLSVLGSLNNLSYFRSKSNKFTTGIDYSLFIKRFFYTRYKFHLLLGFTSSRKFSLFIKDKLVAFSRSVLFFDVKKVSISSTEIFYIGFVINCVSANSKNSSIKAFSNQNNAVLKNKLYFRLSRIKKKFLNSFLSRIRSELVLNFSKRKSVFGLNVNHKFDHKFWVFFFQLESSRSFRYYSLLFSDDLSDRKFS
jgi:hypothetical protein